MPGFSNASQAWNARYARPDFLFGTHPNIFLASHRDLLVSGGKALCVADGEGRNSVWLAQQGLEVDAFDVASVAVSKAREFAGKAGASVNFHIEDCATWTWQADMYEYVVAIFVQFADPEMRAKLFANMIRTLKPGGYLILQGYTPRQLLFKTGGPPYVEHLYTEDLLKRSFMDLNIVELRSYEAFIEEGTAHHGMSALVGMVGQKRSSL